MFFTEKNTLKIYRFSVTAVHLEVSHFDKQVSSKLSFNKIKNAG